MDAGQDYNFQSSNLFCIYHSLFETNPNKQKYSIYEKLSQKDERNKDEIRLQRGSSATFEIKSGYCRVARQGLLCYTVVAWLGFKRHATAVPISIHKLYLNLADFF